MSLTQEELRRVLSYDPETGLFSWRSGKRTGRGNLSVGCKRPSGYVVITVFGSSFRAHRLAWFYVTGAWPIADIDHINGVRDDNKFSNLREASRAQNLQNTGKRPHNKCGLKGVCWYPRHNRWVAYIRAQGKSKNLGYFDSPEAAHAAYCFAAKKYHGEFAHF